MAATAVGGVKEFWSRKPATLKLKTVGRVRFPFRRAAALLVPQPASALPFLIFDTRHIRGTTERPSSHLS